MQLPESKLTKSQKLKFRKEFEQNGAQCVLIAKVRHDDECGNGHNTFAITGDLYENGHYAAGGCIHDDISEHFPDLAPFIQWHLCSTDGPLHYLANTLYLAGDKDFNGKGKQPEIEAARSAAIWPDATLEQLRDRAQLEARLPALMQAFKRDVESLGLVY